MTARVDQDEWLATVAAGTDMGAATAAFDWAAKPLGAPASWSVARRGAVSLCLSSRFPMMVLWGRTCTSAPASR